MIFITIEGCDGVGKTTQSKFLFNNIKKIITERVIYTREPGGLLFAEKIRKLILDNEDIDIKTQLMLFLAARNEHLKKIILPYLQAGWIVICDRFIDSTIVYQGYVQNASKEEIKDLYFLNNFVVEGLEPNLTILIDFEDFSSLRIKRNNFLDNKEKEFYMKVRDGFREIAKENKRLKIVDMNDTFIKDKILNHAINALF